MKTFWKHPLVILIGVLVLIFGAGALVRAKKSNEQITTITPEKKELVQSIQVSGVVQAHERASLRFLAGGKLVYLGAKEGDVVRKWQTIASIDKSELKKQLEKDLNDYSNTRIDFDQKMDDLKDKQGDTAVDRTREKTQNTLENAVVTVEIRDIILKNSSLYAPFDGVLVSSPAQTVGEILVATDVFEIVNPTSLYVETEVDEADISKIRVGQNATVIFDALPDTEESATVTSIAYASSESSNGTVYKVKLSLPVEHMDQYRLGMNATAKIELDRVSDALVIPASSLISRDGKTFVEVMVENKKIEKEIILGLETDVEVEVLSGISSEDRIVKK
ncbi:MAG: Secretion protein HlyD [Microgenomates group bacterium GW2011_GWF2_45_18]|nr:MAG: Secretion protein HlyD [Microgenomates group bacterium GW2011_GWF1_44_10]KKU02245.1 MAG: Secretion protein HlyD [Microgenomates group bacterium GW2011_GWF2_45_18]OGJ41260.1 MAG: hypothetical protein A2378_01715 [Candidatus Pacebacteria bacterium RIFOXYB1_FULL_44_10]HAX01821.1 hypothetical protein [Candidatus Paceibacterota bacterium]